MVTVSLTNVDLQNCRVARSFDSLASVTSIKTVFIPIPALRRRLYCTAFVSLSLPRSYFMQIALRVKRLFKKKRLGTSITSVQSYKLRIMLKVAIGRDCDRPAGD